MQNALCASKPHKNNMKSAWWWGWYKSTYVYDYSLPCMKKFLMDDGDKKLFFFTL